MNRLVPFLFVLSVSAGSPCFAQVLISKDLAVNSQVVQSDREFLRSHSDDSAPVAAPATPVRRPEPIAERKETRVTRVAPIREAAPKVVNRSRVVATDPSPIRTEVVVEDEAPNESSYVRRERVEDDGYAPREEGHRRRLHIGRFILRILPF